MSLDERLWFEYDDDNISNVRILARPYDNIVIGSSPEKGMTLETARSFDIYINVSENAGYSYSDKRPRPDTRFYFAQVFENEPWGYWPFYMSREVLDEAFTDKKRVYLHCHSGINRSPCIAMGWLMSRGHSIEEASDIINDSILGMSEINIEKFLSNQMLGFIPSRLDEMYELQNNGKNMREILDYLGVSF